MDENSLFEVPLYFIKEYLNGWIVLVIICVMIYFIILRNYYIKREQFYDQAMHLKNISDVEDEEENIINDSFSKTYDEDNLNSFIDNNNNNNNNNNDNENIEDDIKNIDMNVNSKANKKLVKKKKHSGEDNTVLVGTKVFEGLDDINGNIEGFEGFESPMTTSYASTSINSVTKPAQSVTKPAPSVTKPSRQPQIINTTLFDNININSTQINLCKINYTQVINTCITDLSKLVKLKKNNDYLNTKKQFDIIIGRGVDNIINYVSNTIKSPIILTRTSIKTDLIDSLSNTVETLINNNNNDITNQMNSLAMMNSTTIDYNTMLKNINDSRTELDNYIEIDKLIVNNGKNLNNFNKEVNNVLNKSFVLPIYERNFDKINQLVKSDFNENETNLANKYGQVYTDFLNEKKKSELDINPLRLASKIESGIVDMLTSLVDNNKDNKESNQIIEQNNPIPEQQYNIISDNNLNKNTNIYKDRGNLGSYLIDKKTQKQVLEGFEDSTTNKISNNTSSETTKYEYKSKKNKNNKDLISNLMSGDFLQYIMDIMNDKLGYLFSMYNNKFESSNSNNKDNNNKFNLEENMIPAGFLLFILSMLIYFIDTTS